MRICRKIAALGLCAVLLVSLISMVFAADAAPVLQFDENGEFKILIVADTQDIDKPQKETIALLEAELDAAQPDLVVFLGDQIHGPSTGKSVERAGCVLAAGGRTRPAIRRRLRQPRRRGRCQQGNPDGILPELPRMPRVGGQRDGRRQL